LHFEICILHLRFREVSKISTIISQVTDFSKLNMWADLIGVVLVLMAFGQFWSMHLVGNLLTGRLQERFIDGNWHPAPHLLPASPKIMHGMHLAGMIGLGLSGLYIRVPYFGGARTVMRFVHYACAYVVTINFVARIYYAYAVDAKEFFITKKDLFAMPTQMKYLFFMLPVEKEPSFGKYNPMQRLTYFGLIPGPLILMVVTGFSMLWPQVILAPIAPFVGGIAAAAAYARVIHFLMCMMLIMTTMIHMYLAITENFPGLLDFFGIKPFTEEDIEAHNLAHGGHGGHGSH